MRAARGPRSWWRMDGGMMECRCAIRQRVSVHSSDWYFANFVRAQKFCMEYERVTNTTCDLQVWLRNSCRRADVFGYEWGYAAASYVDTNTIQHVVVPCDTVSLIPNQVTPIARIRLYEGRHSFRHFDPASIRSWKKVTDLKKIRIGIYGRILYLRPPWATFTTLAFIPENFQISPNR